MFESRTVIGIPSIQSLIAKKTSDAVRAVNGRLVKETGKCELIHVLVLPFPPLT